MRPQARPGVTIENCEALHFSFEPGGLRCLVVWRDGPKLLRPADESKRLRELKPGDEAILDGKLVVIRSVDVFR